MRDLVWIVCLAACGRDVELAPADGNKSPNDGARDATFFRDAPFDSALTTHRIQTDTTVPYTPGAATGYYVSYVAGGHWRLDFTGDATLPTFSGTASALYWDVLDQAQQQDCSSTCSVVSLASVDTGMIGFSATPTQSTDYFVITFDVVAGDPVEVDLLVNGSKQPALVWYPDGGEQSPSALPTLFLPTEQ